MSNLGLYQIMTTAAKKMGGPIAFLGAIFVGGYISLRSGEAGIKKLAKKKKAKKEKLCPFKGRLFEVTSSRKDSSGLIFQVGEQFRVLECDGDAFLIEKLGDNNNPYFVSLDFLKTISNIDTDGENQ